MSDEQAKEAEESTEVSSAESEDPNAEVGVRRELRAEVRPIDPESSEIGDLIHRNIVLDTRGEILYIGKLEHIGQYFYTLIDADVHDMMHGRTSKEIYILESFKYGVKKNRRRVFVRKCEVISLSALDEVIEY